MQKYKGADGLRSIACFMVVFHHAAQRIKIEAMPNWIQEISKFLLTGSAGVSVFFVLSGFLLSTPFWDAYFEGKAFPNIKIYFMRRAGRIIPGFYLNLFICFFLGLTLVENAPALIWRYWAGLTFTSSFHWLTLFPAEINGPLWSIGYEVVSYVLMPLGMFLLFKVNNKRSFTQAVIIWIIIWFFTMFFHYLWIHYFPTNEFGKGWQYGLVGGAKEWMPKYNPIGFFGHFIFGIFTGLITVKLNSKDIKNSIINHKIYDVLACILLILWILLLLSRAGQSEFSLNILNQPYYFPLFSILTSLLLLSVIQSKYVCAVFDNKLAKITAKLSFGIYLWHYVLMILISLFIEKKYVYMGMDSISYWILITLIVIILSYSISAISWYFFEEPILRKAQSWNGDKFMKITNKNILRLLIIFFIIFIFPAIFGIIRPNIFFSSDIFYH